MKAVRFYNQTRSISPLSNRLHYLPNYQAAHRYRLFHQQSPLKNSLAIRFSKTKTQPVASTIRKMSVVATPTEQFLPFLRPEDKLLYNNVMTTSQEPAIHSSFEEKTGTWQYVVADPATKKAVIIDAVLDYDANSRTISTSTADKLLATISYNGYRIEKILETHAHADHLTAASYLQHRLSQMQGFRPPICIGKRIDQVQQFFAAKYGIPAQEYEGAFDQLFEDGESFALGQLTVKVMHLPGHTPDHLGYQISSKCASKRSRHNQAY
jgi:glyoxylase-like metal-dependent hydrolase (beta-lactamase superfamily II)